MKHSSDFVRSVLRCVGVFALSTHLFWGTAHAQNLQLDTAARQLESALRSEAQARRGQWVELPTGGWSTRHFVAELHRRDVDNAVLVRQRIDYVAATPDGAATVVETAWLYCDTGQMRVVATHGYDMQGRKVFGTETPDAPAKVIERLYSGREQLICSQQYLLLDVANGYQRLADVLLMRRSMRADAMADRPMPQP